MLDLDVRQRDCTPQFRRGAHVWQNARRRASPRQHLGRGMRSTMGMLDEINAAAEQAAEGMSEEQLRAAFIAAQQETAKRKAKQKEYNLNPENKAKRLTYQKDRNERIKADPEQYAKVQATRKAYMSKPEVDRKSTRLNSSHLGI